MASSLEVTTARILRVGIYIAAGVCLVGALLFLPKQGSTKIKYQIFDGVSDQFTSIKAIINSAWHLSGEGIVQFGLLLLIATPVIRVFFTIFAFLLEKDNLYALFSLIVFLILIYSFISSGV